VLCDPIESAESGSSRRRKRDARRVGLADKVAKADAACADLNPSALETHLARVDPCV